MVNMFKVVIRRGMNKMMMLLLCLMMTVTITDDNDSCAGNIRDS